MHARGRRGSWTWWRLGGISHLFIFCVPTDSRLRVFRATTRVSSTRCNVIYRHGRAPVLEDIRDLAHCEPHDAGEPGGLGEQRRDQEAHHSDVVQEEQWVIPEPIADASRSARPASQLLGRLLQED